MSQLRQALVVEGRIRLQQAEQAKVCFIKF
jgi:hypothetical protein